MLDSLDAVDQGRDTVVDARAAKGRGLRAGAWSVLSHSSNDGSWSEMKMNLDRIRHLVWRWRRDAAGQVVMEYALLMSLIAIVAMGAVQTVGTTVSTLFWDVIAAATP
jgi:Flp pilus assembly pilin Flp